MSWIQANRRNFLKSLAALPGVGALLPAPLAVAAKSNIGGRDVISELGIRTFINAAGTYTTLTASLMPPEVLDAIHNAGRKFCPLNDLHDAVGERIAKLVKSEAAMVSSGAASALSLSTAACIAGKDREKIVRLPDTTGMKNEVIVQKSHRNGYDHAIRNAGVRLIEIETAAELESAIHDRTAMLFFLNSAAKEGQIGLEDFTRLGKKHNVPTMIDAAADVPPVENLWRFTEIGFDLVVFSGGKGIRGPQSAGLLLGRKDLIEAARMNGSPNSDSLCRTNKVNKEELVGMMVALEMFVNRDHKAVWKDWEEQCGRIAKAAKGVDSVTAEMFVPELANAVPHLRINWDHAKLGMTPREAVKKLREGDPSIEVRPGSNEALEIAVWMLQPGEDKIVANRVKEVLRSA